MISGKILRLNGWPEGKVISLAKAAAEALERGGLDRDAVLARLGAVRQNPGPALADPLLAELARECLRLAQPASAPDDDLRERPLPYPVWGKDNIDGSSLAQMDAAMRLPVATAGALMPDAHVGYGLPIGGVLAVENAVIPYAVGVDIACRMRLSVYELSPHLLGQKKSLFEDSLWTQTAFGMGVEWKGRQRAEHAVLDDPAWKATRLLVSLLDKAHQQLGTSGTGNHFVEWGAFHLSEMLGGLAPGDYLALLSHSGSRGVGFKIADRYSKLAMELHPGLDKSARHLAWLTLDSEAGQEYWLSMELAGRFASANHYVIHQRVAAAMGLKEAAVVENHHNFCLPGDAIVPTPSGPKRMKDIVPGGRVYTLDTEQGVIESKVLRHWTSGAKPIRTIRTSNRKLAASYDHPILTVQLEQAASGRARFKGVYSWKKMSEICIGEIVICAHEYYANTSSIGKDRARFIGAFLGDGWIRHDTSHGRYTVGLAIGTARDKHTLRYLALLQKVLPSAHWSVDAPGAFGLTCASAKVWREVDRLGLAKYSREKRLPSWAFELSGQEKLALLAGYFDSDGSVASPATDNHGRGVISSTNRELVDEIRELAIGCGLRITPVRRELVKSNFGDAIGYRCVLSADSTNQLELWNDTKSRHQRQTLYNKPQGLISKKLGKLSLPSGVFAQRVLAIDESENAQQVYDLSIEHASHSFVVEGLVVHNCWRETLSDGQAVYVHRKGATPAGPGVLGVIPGSMGDAGYVVRGKGNADSLNSASHGAGRLMSRRAALDSIAKSARDSYLKERGVTLLGGGMDESPQAYKSIEAVIAAQTDLVDLLGKFTPRIVRMADEPGDV